MNILHHMFFLIFRIPWFQRWQKLSEVAQKSQKREFIENWNMKNVKKTILSSTEGSKYSRRLWRREHITYLYIFAFYCILTCNLFKNPCRRYFLVKSKGNEISNHSDFLNMTIFPQNTKKIKYGHYIKSLNGLKNF